MILTNFVRLLNAFKRISLLLLSWSWSRKHTLIVCGLSNRRNSSSLVREENKRFLDHQKGYEQSHRIPTQKGLFLMQKKKYLRTSCSVNLLNVQWTFSPFQEDGKTPHEFKNGKSSHSLVLELAWKPQQSLIKCSSPCKNANNPKERMFQLNWRGNLGFPNFKGQEQSSWNDSINVFPFIPNEKRNIVLAWTWSRNPSPPPTNERLSHEQRLTQRL